MSEEKRVTDEQIEEVKRLRDYLRNLGWAAICENIGLFPTPLDETLNAMIEEITALRKAREYVYIVLPKRCFAIAAFSDGREAFQFCATHADHGWMRMKVDDALRRYSQMVWTARLDVIDGKASAVQISSDMQMVAALFEADLTPFESPQGITFCGRSAISREHAIQLVQEAYAKWLAAHSEAKEASP